MLPCLTQQIMLYANVSVYLILPLLSHVHCGHGSATDKLHTADYFHVRSWALSVISFGVPLEVWIKFSGIKPPSTAVLEVSWPSFPIPCFHLGSGSMRSVLAGKLTPGDRAIIMPQSKYEVSFDHVATHTGPRCTKPGRAKLPSFCRTTHRMNTFTSHAEAGSISTLNICLSHVDKQARAMDLEHYPCPASFYRMYIVHVHTSPQHGREYPTVLSTPWVQHSSCTAIDTPTSTMHTRQLHANAMLRGWCYSSSRAPRLPAHARSAIHSL